jgi:hypothetical protein
MEDLMARYTTDYLAKFDAVLAHAFDVFKSKQEGAQLPPFMEVYFYNKAKQYALALHRTGNLENMYERITKGAV